ncbi:MAG TPA: hypothetical protein VN982_14715 [Candidatus Dormibacteraeota bacterium]|nr:hypothetical protein [Candidatus Dormibacteraeota bacterium]
MKRTLLLTTFLAAIFMNSCGHGSSTCTINCGGGNATLNVTMSTVPLTPPPATSILSFSLTVTGMSLTPTTGSDINIPLTATTYVFDAAKLQSDSAFLGQIRANVPAGTYNKITLAVTNASVTFCTQPNPGVAGCSASSIATVNANPLVSTPASALSLTLAANDQRGVRLQLNIAMGLTLNGQVVTALTLNPPPANPLPILSAVTLPPLKSSLASGQLDFVEDFTGVVTAITASTVTVTTSGHGAITAVSNASTSFSPNCLITGLGTAEDFSHCVTLGQLASIDTALNADGTFTLLEYDPLEAVATDWIEGTVTSTPASTTQFQIVANDLFLKPAASLIGTNLLPGTPVTVNLRSTATGGVKFAVDSKGLNVPINEVNLFSSSNDTSVLKPGQTVAVHVVSFTPAGGGIPPTVTTDVVQLRFTRVTGTVTVVAPLNFTIRNLPPYFGATIPLNVQLNQTVFPSRAATNYDGVTDATGLIIDGAVSIRAIYFPTSTAQPFSAAKVRK